MRALKTFLLVAVLILIAFGVGYGLGYWKLQTAQKEWAAAREGMESRIGTLEKELALAKARETLRDMSDVLDQVLAHISEKKFGLAVKTIDGLKQSYLTVQGSLQPEMKARLEFLVPALDEARKETESLSPNAGKKTEEIKRLLEEKLKSPRKN